MPLCLWWQESWKAGKLAYRQEDSGKMKIHDEDDGRWVEIFLPPAEDVFHIGYRRDDSLYVGAVSGRIYRHQEWKEQEEGWLVFVHPGVNPQ